MAGREIHHPDTAACALCGYVYAPAAGTPTCGGCPLAAQCTMTCCPVCGYEIPFDRPRGAARPIDRVRHLIGCVAGPGDLSTNVEKRFKEIILARHRARRSRPVHDHSLIHRLNRGQGPR